MLNAVYQPVVFCYEHVCLCFIFDHAKLHAKSQIHQCHLKMGEPEAVKLIEQHIAKMDQVWNSLPKV